MKNSDISDLVSPRIASLLTVELILLSRTLKLETLLRAVAIEPDEIWRRGEPVTPGPGSHRKREFSGLRILSRLGDSENASVEAQLMNLLDRLEPRRREIQEIVAASTEAGTCFAPPDSGCWSNLPAEALTSICRQGR